MRGRQCTSYRYILTLFSFGLAHQNDPQKNLLQSQAGLFQEVQTTVIEISVSSFIQKVHLKQPLVSSGYCSQSENSTHERTLVD